MVMCSSENCRHITYCIYTEMKMWFVQHPVTTRDNTMAQDAGIHKVGNVRV